MRQLLFIVSSDDTTQTWNIYDVERKIIIHKHTVSYAWEREEEEQNEAFVAELAQYYCGDGTEFAEIVYDVVRV